MIAREEPTPKEPISSEIGKAVVIAALSAAGAALATWAVDELRIRFGTSAPDAVKK